MFAGVAGVLAVAAVFWLLWPWASVPWNRFLGVSGAAWLWMAGAVGGGCVALVVLRAWQPRPLASALSGAVGLAVFGVALFMLWVGLECWETELSCGVRLHLWAGLSPLAGFGATCGIGFLVRSLSRESGLADEAGGIPRTFR